MIQEKDIPKGWIYVSLGELFLIERGGSPRPIEDFITKDTDGINWIKIGDTKGIKKYIFKTKEKIKPSGILRSRKVFIDDFILSNSMSFGRPYIMKTEGCIHDGWLVIRTPKNYINNDFLYYILSSQFVYQQFSNLAKGSTVKNLNIEAVKKVYIFLPPLLEQHRIATKLEELYSRLDKGIENLKLAKAQLKVYRQAVLKWAFEGKLTGNWRNNNNLLTADKLLNEIKKERQEFCKFKKLKVKPIKEFTEIELSELPSLSIGWNWVNIDAISEHEKHSIKAGPFGSSLKKEFYVQNGYKIYGQEQVISGNPNIGDYFINVDKYNELYSCRVKPFDVLISLVGTIGKVLILPENSQDGIINPRLIKISLNQKYYNPLFFKYYFESSFLKAIYKQNAHGATMDVLNLGIIQVLPFPFCTLQEQQEIIQEIESRLSVCDKIEESINTSLSQAEALRQSILKKAFEGKLVAQDQNDEPAWILLEKIKEERAKYNLVKKVSDKKVKSKTEIKVKAEL